VEFRLVKRINSLLRFPFPRGIRILYIQWSPLVVTNQRTTQCHGGKQKLVAALGPMCAHALNTRLEPEILCPIMMGQELHACINSIVSNKTL